MGPEVVLNINDESNHNPEDSNVNANVYVCVHTNDEKIKAQVGRVIKRHYKRLLADIQKIDSVI